MKKYRSGVIIIAIGLFLISASLFSENCFPRIIENEYFVRRDGENVLSLVVGLVILAGGFLKLWKGKSKG